MKVPFFLFSLISLSGVLGTFFKSPLGDSGVCPELRWRMAEIHQDGQKKLRMFSL